ncbi:MAG: 6,7-dimethyl-8-ribityllumazine synthase [Verrucomicrobiales bacterium]
MSTALPPKPRMLGSKANICIVAAKYNEQFTDALVENTVNEIGELMPSTRIDLIRVPGAFEIPAVASAVLNRKRHACLIGLGVIIKGATAHADLVAQSVTTALQDLAVKHRLPVINEVLLLEDEKQAYARCIGANLNRGKEAARAATAMVDVFQELDRTMPSGDSSFAKS